MNQKIVSKKIAKSIESLTKQGYTLISEDWGDNDKKCACALGCFALSIDMESDLNIPNIEDLAAKLEVSVSWVNAFIYGFDDCSWSFNSLSDEVKDSEDIEELTEAYKLGIQFRLKFKPIPIHLVGV